MTMDHGELPATLTLEQIRRFFVPLGRRTIHRLISSGDFPRADIAIGGKVRLWRRATIEEWLETHSTGRSAIRPPL